eukprot:CAMPEP_0183708740 /NCGR_PEP_ID=MMETSP0737-20130205/4954_1 /TAXON_ID=385413 /ORGANISM="Thalassiosira miniscula, Strain CCMP1093" /LENGTH=547 /DNA_ID=CAMNT_0025936663 /DNA_START=184 /DNA_END=1827 /DNA_ORIENTATION=+
MIETRESTHQPLLNPKRTPPTSPGKRKKQLVGKASYGTLKGEALYDAGASFSKQESSNPQSVLEPQYQYASSSSDYPPQQQPMPMQKGGVVPLQQATTNANNVKDGRLPPAIPLRHRADSGDRSVGELSTVSGVSGQNRLTRSSNPPPEGSSSGGGDGFLLPGVTGVAYPPQPPTRSRSPNPRPPRTRSPTPTSGNGHPLHQRRSSDEYSLEQQQQQHHQRSSSFSNRHRRTHSYDMPVGSEHRLKRGNSSHSLLSLHSIHSAGSARSQSETIGLLPDPRWGGGSGGGRARSFSNGSASAGGGRGGSFGGGAGGGMLGSVSYSADSSAGGGGGPLLQQPHQQFGYGSVSNHSSGNAKEVVGVMEMGRSSHHRRNHSELSAASYASVDRSVDPVVTDMGKSAMFKGVTNDGVVKLQLPKDNFRLLSDRDLESGCVYKRALVDNEDDYFQDYHITIDPDVDAPPLLPTTSCENCHGRRKPLPPSYYVMAVDSDIYRRMFDEVAESMNMPCKLFYCGHHEDVDYPSIGIAVVGVAILFVVMIWVTVFVDG